MTTVAARRLPGDLMMWVLILSELAVFSAGLLAFLAVRVTDPAGFLAAQDRLHRVGAGVNTVVLVTSGLMAALALAAIRWADLRACRLWLGGAGALGVVFLILKALEYRELLAQGVGTGNEAFFTFYFLLTGFHAAHVVAGVLILALVAIRPRVVQVEAGAQFWHMVDLVWMILFPVLYLVR